MSQTPASYRSSLLTNIFKRVALAVAGCFLPVAVCLPVSAQMQVVPTINTYAGNGAVGFSGDGGPAINAAFGSNAPRGAAYDSQGNLYLSDGSNNRVRKIAPNGIISTIAGTGAASSTGDGGPAINATLNFPVGVALDSTGNLYIGEFSGARIRKIDARTGIITTIAGNGVGGYSGDGGPATSAVLNGPQDPNFDAAGNLYFADYGNQRVRKINMSTGIITTVAGNGVAGGAGDGGSANSAQLNGPVGVVFDTAQNLYIAERNGARVRRVAAGTGIISTFAGTGAAGYSGDGGPATSARLAMPYGLAFDVAGNVLIADSTVQRVRSVNIATGIITTVAGNGVAGYSGDGGPATAAQLNQPVELVTSPAGEIYICDAFNHRMRNLNLRGIGSFPTTNIGSTSLTQIIQIETTQAETISSITIPQSQGGKQEYVLGAITGCTVDGTTTNPDNTICTFPITFTPAYPGRRWVPLQVVTSAGNINFGLTGIGVGPLAGFTPGIISTIAGNGTSGYLGDGSAASTAEISMAYRQTFDSAGNLYIADYGNNRVRKVTAGTGIISTIAGNGTPGYLGDGGLATSAEINGPQGVAVDSAGNLYIADYGNLRIREVSAATGIITTVAGNGNGAETGDGGSATNAGLASPADVAMDSAGNLYIADYFGHRIRKVTAASGNITTVAGTGTAGYSGDGGAATNAMLKNPVALAIDSADNLYIADQQNERIRKVTASSGVISTVAGTGTVGSAGDGGLATSAQLNNPGGVGIDSAGNLYIGDEANNKIRKVDGTTGMITTFAGTGVPGFSGDGGVATQAQLAAPLGVTFDNPGNVFLSDLSNSRIRKLDLSQSALTYPTATMVGTSDSTDNPRSVILSNIGNGSLTIPPPSTGSNPNISSNFVLDSISTCPELLISSNAQTLGSGASCTMAIDFKPVQAGALTGTAVETDNSLNLAGSTQIIRLFANGLAASTTTTLSSSLNPSISTQSVTFTAVISPVVGTALPTGTVQFIADGTSMGSPVTLVNGVATYTTSTLAVGTHAVTAIYAPDTSNFGASTGTLTQMVNPESTTTTVVSSVNPSQYMQSVTFTATVVQTAGTTMPTGSIQFSADGTNLGSPVTLSGGTASFTTSTLTIGLHAITASYAPNFANFAASSGSNGQRVGAVASSTTTLAVAPTTVMYGDTATLAAVVAPTFATGTVSFYEGTTLLGSASLNNAATAVLPIKTLNAGVHTIVAKYNGDPGVPSSTSNTVQLTVTQRTAPNGGPAITVIANDASRTTTQSNPPFTYSASGQLVNGDTYATAINGAPNYSTSGGSMPGTYSIAVSDLISQNYTIAFVAGTLTVTTTPTTTTLVASPTSTQYGDPLSLTATVTSGATGTVSFYDGSILLGTGQLTNGLAMLTSTTLIAGTHTVTAVYNGDAIYASSQSGPQTLAIAKRHGIGGGPALTITVQNASREYSTADPQFAYVVTGTLVNGDTYSPAVIGTPIYSAADTATSPAGSSFPISVSGLTSTNYEITVVNGTLTVAPAPTTTILTSSTSAAQYGDPVTLTATVAPNGATGTVLFMNGSIVLGVGTVTNGVATLSSSSLSVGSYLITANYQGDAGYGTSTSTPVTLTINQRTGPGGVAALTVTVTDGSRGYGQGNPAFTYTITGALVNGDSYSTAIAGVPVYSTTAIPLSSAGGYPISITGLNSQNYRITFVNGTLTVTKNTPGQNGVANITLTSSPNPSTIGQSVTFTATVPSGATGTLQFMDGSTLLGSGTVSSTTATFLTSTLAIGTHPVTAVYSGDANYNSATSTVDNHVVNSNLDFTLTLTSAGTRTVIPGDTASYTVQVAPTNVVYPGTVTFTATGLPIGATIHFSPNTVAVNGSTQPIEVKVQTASQKAGLNRGSVDATFLAFVVLPLASSRRIRRSSRRFYFYLLILLLGGVVVGLTGCGYNGNGFFGQAPQNYSLTMTATSGTIQHSVKVTLNVQ